MEHGEDAKKHPGGSIRPDRSAKNGEDSDDDYPDFDARGMPEAASNRPALSPKDGGEAAAPQGCSRRKKKCKDGKSKRDRYRKLCDEMIHRIEAAPDDFEVDTEALPECIAKDEWLKRKLLTRLKKHQEQVQKNLVSL
jgi:hypothetical protein